jgi:antitoxin MazE
MKSRIQKWGNSLALRIPKSFAIQAGLCEDTPVNLSVTEGKLVVQPDSEEPLCLDRLLAEITDENLHGEWDTGPMVGKEIW